jgi:hypothetical protein
MKADPRTDRQPALMERIKSMFPVDWEIVRHMGAEPIPYHLKNGGSVWAAQFSISSSSRSPPASR